MNTSESGRSHVKFCDLSSAAESHRQELLEAVERVLDSGWYILGKEVSSFETDFAAFVGSDRAVGVANGTDAIEISLRALGVGPDDIVVTVSHTAVATVAAIERSGAIPAFVDIDPETYTMSPDSLEVLLSRSPADSRIKAIIPVHMYGQMADMDSLGPIARKYGLKIVEDCAQAHGARIGSQTAGSTGDLGAFSFYPTKNLGGFGDGGCVTTSDNEIYERLLRIRQYGWKKRFISEETGINSRLDEMQAALLRVCLVHLEDKNSRRRAIAARYNEIISGNKNLEFPVTRDDAYHVYHLYVIKNPEREALTAHLAEYGIETAVHYPLPVHKQPAYSQGKFLKPVEGLPVTEEVCDQILSIPLYPEMSDQDVEQVCSALETWPGTL